MLFKDAICDNVFIHPQKRGKQTMTTIQTLVRRYLHCRFPLYIFVMAAGVFAMATQPLFAAYNAAGGYVTLLGHNLGSKGESTFMTNIVRSSYGWSDGRDPHSGTNYYCGSDAQLCSPKVTGGAFTFPGDSLTIGHRLIALATSTIVVEDLCLEKKGYLMVNGSGALSLELQGNLTILGDASKPSWFDIGRSPSHFKVESAFKGASSAYAYSAQADANPSYRQFVSFETQYIELDDADEYYGTFEVRTNTCLKLASDLPGTVAVANGGCLTSVGSVAIGTLSLMDGAFLDFPDGGTITVENGFSASGTIAIKASDCTSFPRALLVVPTNSGTLDARSFAGDGLRITVVVENGVQTLYAELLEPAVFDETTGYVTQIAGGTVEATSLKNIFDEPSAWSDNRIPHPDTNYYGNIGIYLTTNSVFAGRSLTIEKSAFRLLSGKSADISDLRVKGGTSATSSIFTSAGGSGRFYLSGKMTVLSRLTESWPFAFLGGADGQTWVTSQKITGDNSRAFSLYGHPNNAPGAVSNYVEFLGDLSEYFGTMIIGTNSTARLGGSSMPGTISLGTSYSHIETMAPVGAEVSIGKIESLASTSIVVAETNSLAVADSFAVTGTLTKNGSGLLAVGGTASAGAAAALNVALGGLRADSAHALDGIEISFADGTTYVRDCADADEGLVQCGLYNTAAVTAVGVLNVDLKNLDVENVKEVALFTVPGSSADALASAVRFVSRPKGYGIDKVVSDADAGQKTVKAVLHVAGLQIIFR